MPIAAAAMIAANAVLATLFVKCPSMVWIVGSVPDFTRILPGFRCAVLVATSG
jgi:hypothetical protein